jgi:hypothetical protein
MDFEVKVIERNFMIRVHYSGGFKAENVLYVSVRRGYGKVSEEGVLFPLSSLRNRMMGISLVVECTWR